MAQDENVEHSSALQLQGTEANQEQIGEIFWTIARQHPRSDWAHVDFWSKPLCECAYTAQLPLTIGRGTLMFGTIDNQANARLSHCDSSLREKHNKLFSNRLCFQSGAGINSLTELLRTRVNVNVKSSRARTTALIALDSRWSTSTLAGLDWAEILPAFRGCYDQVIGHYHINQRGFHHWKNWMKEGPFNASSFERFFTSAASQCDAVVITSQSLIENDMHLPARASTESLVGELMQRFSQVLFDDEITRDVVPTGQANCEPKQPRIYALGSAGASRTYPAVELAGLLRQREVTFSSFGKPVRRALE